jgi:hypothetical protein
MRTLVLVVGLFGCNPFANRFSGDVEIKFQPHTGDASPSGIVDTYVTQEGTIDGENGHFSIHAVDLNADGSHIYTRGVFDCPKLDAKENGGSAGFAGGGACSLVYETSYETGTLMLVDRYDFTLDDGWADAPSSHYIDLTFEGSYQKTTPGAAPGDGSFNFEMVATN